MKADYDVAIIGSGFGGSLLAMIARRLGRSVVLLEKGKHPRFVIGESSTPLANLLLEELATRYDLPRLLPLTKWGTWQSQYPKVGCGLKRGFTFLHHVSGENWAPKTNRANELLVAASPNDAIADTHWFRADFDAFLVQEALSLGVDYLDEAKLENASVGADGMELTGERRGKPLRVQARMVFDASGPRGFLHTSLQLGEHTFQHLAQTHALYSHFTGVRRWDELYRPSVTPPYPVDDAALHHLFDGGWMWVLRFNNGLTSAGVAATKGFSDKLKLHEGAPGWSRLLEQFPSIREQFNQAKGHRPFTFTPQLAFRSARIAGPCWALLPSSAGFIDPLLSTGFPLTLLGIIRLAQILSSEPSKQSFDHYAQQTASELDLVEKLVAALYRHLGDFEVFGALTLLYFAAASFTETVRRLGHPDRGGEHFLLGEHPTFGPNCRRCLKQALQPLDAGGRRHLLHLIDETIAPIDIAGLSNRKRLNHYPVLAQDLLDSGWKTGASAADIQALLARCGMQ